MFCNLFPDRFKISNRTRQSFELIIKIETAAQVKKYEILISEEISVISFSLMSSILRDLMKQMLSLTALKLFLLRFRLFNDSRRERDRPTFELSRRVFERTKVFRFDKFDNILLI